MDTNKPTLSIANLKAGQPVSNAVFTVKGTASDNWQVSNVVCQINGGGWNSATNITLDQLGGGSDADKWHKHRVGLR